MFIKKSMTQTVYTISEEKSLFEAKHIMETRHIRHLPVVTDDNRLMGIITDRDIRSAMPSIHLSPIDLSGEMEKVSQLKIKDVMTKDPVTVSPTYTIQDALLLIQKLKVGALPVVDDEKKVTGIISVRDLLRAFINVLGLKDPGTLLCVIAEEKVGQLKKIVDAVTEENISFGSILVARYREKGKRAIYPYLLTYNVTPIKKKLEKMGFAILDPMEWAIDQLPEDGSVDE